jgi:hypothetical protein
MINKREEPVLLPRKSSAFGLGLGLRLVLRLCKLIDC